MNHISCSWLLESVCCNLKSPGGRDKTSLICTISFWWCKTRNKLLLWGIFGMCSHKLSHISHQHPLSLDDKPPGFWSQKLNLWLNVCCGEFAKLQSEKNVSCARGKTPIMVKIDFPEFPEMKGKGEGLNWDQLWEHLGPFPPHTVRMKLQINVWVTAFHGIRGPEILVLSCIL